MKETANKTDRKNANKRAAAKRIKEKISEADLTPEELQELRRVARDILDRKRY